MYARVSLFSLSSEQMQPPVVGQKDIGGIAFLAEGHEVVPPWILRLQIVGPLPMIVVGQELAPVQAKRNIVQAKQLPEAAEETILGIGDTGIVDVPEGVHTQHVAAVARAH